MLVTTSAIAADQAAPAELTLVKTLYFFDYVASHPDAILTYNKSNMILAVHSDASYLLESNTRSRESRHVYILDDQEVPPNNEDMHNIAQIIKNVMT